MGIAAYNRGSAAISAQIDRDQRPAAFVLMDELNAMPKADKAPTPFGPVQFVFSHGGCWAQCPVTGFGYFYADLRQAVKAWNVEVTGYDANQNMWTAIPRPKVRS